jgi:hypothetical protein
MKTPKFLLFGIIATSSAICSYGETTYTVSDSVPCIFGYCDGTMSLSGTITTDKIGDLTTTDFVGWSLTFSNDGVGGAIGTDTPDNSHFSLAGSAGIVATDNNLEISLATEDDEFKLLGSVDNTGSWEYANAQNSIVWSTEAQTLLGEEQVLYPLTLTFEATLVGSETPEPASILLVVVGAIYLLSAWKKIHRTSF